MSVKKEVLEKNIVELEVSVGADKYSEAIVVTAKKMSKKMNIPGFRKGKAPRNMIETYVGKESLYHEAAEAIIGLAYEDAIQEADIVPIDYPEISIVQAEDGKDLIFKAKVTVKPEVVLGEYKGLKIEKGTPVVTDDKVEENLKSKQDQHAKITTLEEGSVQNNDTVAIDFEGFLDGVAFPGGKGEDYDLKIGSNTFISGFEEQLIGLHIGQEADLSVQFPDEYHTKDLAGKEVIFKVKINKIKHKELAALDDEFAKDISEFDTLEALKADIREKLEIAEAKRVEDEYNKNIVAKVVDNASVELPEVMLQQRIDYMMNDFMQMLEYQGFNKEQYYEYTGKNEQQIREEFHAQAAEEAKTDLVLDHIAKVEEIAVTEEELDQEIAKVAELYKQEPAVFRETVLERGQLDYYRRKLWKEKTMNFLVDQNA